MQFLELRGICKYCVYEFRVQTLECYVELFTEMYYKFIKKILIKSYFKVKNIVLA